MNKAFIVQIPPTPASLTSEAKEMQKAAILQDFSVFLQISKFLKYIL